MIFVVILMLRHRGCYQRTVWEKFLGPGPQGKDGVSYRLRSLPHLMSIISVSASNLTSLWVVVDNWMEIHHRGLHTHIESDSLSHTPYCWSSETVSTWYGRKAQAWFYSPAAGAAAGRFSPQILTDALDGSDPSPSAEARETGSNIKRAEIRVYHCQNGYTAWHLHDGELCQFIKHLKKPGHFFKSCLERGENCILWEKESIQLEQFVREAGFSDG